MAGIVDDANGLRILVIARDDLLDAIPRTRVIPDIAGQELLEGAWRQVVKQRHWLDAFALQAAELSAHIMAEMNAWFAASKAVGKLVQELSQGGPETKQLIGCHP
jgi:hypothetical protein